MKKTLLMTLATFAVSVGCLFVCTCCENTGSPKVQKENFIFSVKGTDTLSLDRYEVPFASAKRPVMIFAFGGGFQAGDKADSAYVSYFEFLAKNGFVVVSTDYRTALKNMDPARLSSPADFAAALQNAVNTAVEDLYDATDFVIDRESDWNINPEQIVISGSSAGAITVLQAEYYLCNGDKLAAERLPEGFNYAGVISFAGAISEQTLPCWDKKPCPIMFFHGDADRNVPFEHAAIANLGGLWGPSSLSKGLDALQASYYFYKVENAGHEIATLPLSENQFDIMSFLSRQVLGKENLILTTDVHVPVPCDTVVKKDFTVQDYIRANFRGL